MPKLSNPINAKPSFRHMCTIMWKTTAKLPIFTTISRAEHNNLPTTPTSTRTHNQLTHNPHHPSLTLSHNPRLSGANWLFHTIHNPNNNNNLIIKGGSNAFFNQ